MAQKKSPVVESLESSKPYRLSREEREVHIDKCESEDFWHVYTSSKPVMSRLDKWTEAKQIHYMGGEIIAKEYDVPLKSVKINKPRKVSDAMRQRGLKLAMERKEANG